MFHRARVIPRPFALRSARVTRSRDMRKSPSLPISGVLHTRGRTMPISELTFYAAILGSLLCALISAESRARAVVAG